MSRVDCCQNCSLTQSVVAVCDSVTSLTIFLSYCDKKLNNLHFLIFYFKESAPADERKGAGTKKLLIVSTSQSDNYCCY